MAETGFGGLSPMNEAKNKTSNVVAAIPSGSFIRIRKDHPDEWTRLFRGGKDGMATSDSAEDGHVALIFGYDRHNQAQHCECVGPEDWAFSELDMDSLDVI